MKSVLRLTCGECETHLPAYLHGELAPIQQWRVARHLEHCQSCHALYLRQRDLMRDLSLVVPLIGVEHKPDFDHLWIGIQAEIVRPKPSVKRFQARYGLALAALLLAFLLPLTLGNDRRALAAPPTQPAPIVLRLTPSGTAPNAAQTAVAFLTDDISQATPEAPQHTAGPAAFTFVTP